MPKQLTFSQKFPAYHQKAGQPTYFIEKFYSSIDKQLSMKVLMDLNPEKPFELLDKFAMSISGKYFEPKHTTIRGGHRFKKGDYFQPAVWGNDINPKSGRSGAYHSKQIKFAPPTLITDVWDFEITHDENILLGDMLLMGEDLEVVAKNDGLITEDLLSWFKYPEPFYGQVICWNQSVKY